MRLYRVLNLFCIYRFYTMSLEISAIETESTYADPFTASEEEDSGEMSHIHFSPEILKHGHTNKLCA